MADKKNINPDEEVNDNNNNNFKNLIADYLKGQRDEVGNEEMGDKPSEFDKLNKKKTTKQRVTGLASLGNNTFKRNKASRRYGRSRNA
jgi:hypothetical protein|tara:strand:- start:498 stop:761 length:264 start_codon:yes stop_codon:yes gene_type:complete